MRFKTMPDWVEENLLKFPKPGEKVFLQDPPGMRTNVTLAPPWGDTDYACARGFRIAAEVAIEHIRDRDGNAHYLVYPVIFLYRHHIELMLKRLIRVSDESCIRSVTGLEPLSEAVYLKMGREHSLEWMWDQLKPALKARGGKIIPPEHLEGLDYYIRQINEIDPGATAFRYGSEVEETKEKMERRLGPKLVIGLQAFAEAVERLANYLDSIDTYFSVMIDDYHDMLSS